LLIGFWITGGSNGHPALVLPNPSQWRSGETGPQIEPGHLDSLPGSKRQYSGWQELFDQVKVILANHRDIAMQYSPNNLVFTISLVDGAPLI